MPASLRLVLVAAVLIASSVGARGVPLVDEPHGLAWTAADVARHAAATLTRTVEQAAQAQQLGCARHCARLARIFDSLADELRTQTPRAATLAWSLTVVNLDGVDAFALPDGRIVISETLLDERDLSDEAVAFVLAHEMAHSLLEHERQFLSTALLLLPRHIRRSVDDVYVEIDHNLGLLKTLEPVLQQGEFEADELGLLLAASAGYTPRRQLEFLQHEVAESDRRLALVATHPPPLERLQRLIVRLPLAERLLEVAHQ